MLSTKQRDRISKLRFAGYTVEHIADLMKVTPREVRSTEKRGRPKNLVPPEDAYALRLLKLALEEKHQTDRYRQARAVLGNFGPELNMTIADTVVVLERGMEYAIGR